MFKRILLAVDGSSHSLKATEYSISLAQKFDAVIDAVYVEDRGKKELLEASNKEVIESNRKEKTERMWKALEESNVIYGTHILQGEPDVEIVQFANSRECDCIVIGSRGLNPLQSFILGSVSDKVVNKATCPVLVIK